MPDPSAAARGPVIDSPCRITLADVLAAQRGDLAARERVAGGIWPLLRRVARRFRSYGRLVGFDADDLQGLAVAGVLEALADFDPARGGGRPHLFLAKHAEWAIAKALRRAKPLPAARIGFDADGDMPLNEPTDRGPGPADLAGDRDECAHHAGILAPLLAVLTPDQREAVALSFGLATGEWLPLSEVARRRGCSRENVRLLVDRGIKRMREAAGVAAR